MKGPDILPCPRCGRTRLLIHGTGFGEFQITCLTCELQNPTGMSTVPFAVALWNNRARTLERFLAHMNAAESATGGNIDEVNG